ncbi:MAG TPA: hypothetical protein VF727_06320 [Allosphingosinicella sp.]
MKGNFMPMKPLTSMVAGALLLASTATAAQATRPVLAPEPAKEARLGTNGESKMFTPEIDTAIGVLFGLFVIIILIWAMKGDGDETPISPG